MGGVCLIVQVGLGGGLEGTWKIVLDGPRGSRGFGTASSSLARTAGWTLMSFTAIRARGRSKVMSSEGTAPWQDRDAGGRPRDGWREAGLQGWSSGETGASTDGGAATRSAQATVGRLRPAVHRMFMAPAPSPEACGAPKGHRGGQEPLGLASAARVTGKSYRELGERLSQAGGGHTVAT